MEQKVNQDEAEHIFDTILRNDEFNYFALYGKSLILYSQGKFEKSVEFYRKTLSLDALESESNNNTFRNRIIELLEPKDPTMVIILDELKKKYNDIRQESFLLNFITVPSFFQKPKIKQTVSVKPQQATTSTSAQLKKIPNEFFCLICKKGFTKMFSLKRHMHLHNGIKNHSCSICFRSFIQKSDMIRHNATHSDTFDVACTFVGCTKFFKSKKNMRSHLLTHSTERPFKCQECMKAFKTKRLLRFHEGLHRELKPFNCDLCGRGFPVKPYLKSHMVSHMKITPFFCKLCPASYKRNYDLSYHNRIHHKQKVIKEETDV